MRIAVALLTLAAAGCAGPPAVAPPNAPAPPAAPEPAPPAPPADPLEAWARLEPIVPAPPPWDYRLADELGRRAVAVPRLTRVSETPNTVTDEEAWLRRNGLQAPGTGAPTRVVPNMYRGAMRLRVIEQPFWTLAIYGEPTAGRFLLAVNDAGDRHAFDFVDYLLAPAAAPADGGAWPQDLVWAAVAGDRLYVTHAHRTYASSTGGLNGYATALDLTSGELRWRSRPRVANARTFEVVDDALVTGYGFTAEPDALFVLDRFTGEVLSEEPVRTAPTWIFRRDDRLLVRAYDADYVFAVR